MKMSVMSLLMAPGVALQRDKRAEQGAEALRASQSQRLTKLACPSASGEGRRRDDSDVGASTAEDSADETPSAARVPRGFHRPGCCSGDAQVLLPDSASEAPWASTSSCSRVKLAQGQTDTSQCYKDGDRESRPR
jgi:hypothetical protein